jgi:hypothetical protein
MSANIQNMLEQAKRALREGNKLEAQKFLMRITELDQYNEEAWLWLASAVDTEEEKRTCLENVLIINANNAEAKRMMAELERDGASSPMPFTVDDFGKSDSSPAAFTEPLEDTDPFGNSDSFSTPSADPFGGEPSTTDGTWADPFDSGASPFSAETFAPPPPQPPPSSTPPVSSPPAAEASRLYDDPSPAPPGTSFDEADYTSANDDDDDDWDEADEDEVYDLDEEVDYLELVPADIEPTRVPGTDQTTNQGLLIGVGVVAVLNVVALVGLMVQLVL